MRRDNKMVEEIAPSQVHGAASIAHHTPMMQQCVAPGAMA